ncbi:MAG: hypothetical protein KBD63_02090 [Bacteriovoracaceae bacterium]|nr:hypothetical protein [Bacteriovoracaceae bacterium]
MTQTIEIKVKNRVYGYGRGWVFSAKDFSDIAPAEFIRTGLHRLEKKGFVRRVIHGLYDYPKVSKTMGTLPPNIDLVAQAMARRLGVSIQPTGAYAANLLGLSDQVPAKRVYLTEGESKKINIGKVQLIFKNTTPRNMKTAGKVSGLVIQALKFLGKEHIDQKVIAHIKKGLKREEKKVLFSDSLFAPSWITKIIRTQILEGFNG